MPDALIVQNPDQAGLTAPRQDIVSFEQLGQPIKHGQSPPSPSAAADGIAWGCRGHSIGIDTDTLAGQSLDVGEFADPACPARDGTTGARVAPSYRSKRHRPVLVIPLTGTRGHGVDDDIEIEPPLGIAARWVDRPTGSRTVRLRAPRPVQSLPGLNLDVAGRPEKPTRYLSPAVPPCLAAACWARRWSINMFTWARATW
jgi:hypothetical protein